MLGLLQTVCSAFLWSFTLNDTKGTRRGKKKINSSDFSFFSGPSVQSQLRASSLLTFSLSLGMWRRFLTNIHKLTPEFQWGVQGQGKRSHSGEIGCILLLQPNCVLACFLVLFSTYWFNNLPSGLAQHLTTRFYFPTSQVNFIWTAFNQGCKSHRGFTTPTLWNNKWKERRAMLSQTQICPVGKLKCSCQLYLGSAAHRVSKQINTQKLC